MVALPELPKAPEAIEVLFEDLRTETDAKLERIEGRLLELGWKDLPVTHRFAPGVYMREGVVPAGDLILGHAHKEEHLTVFYRGKALFCMGGKVSLLTAPCVVTCKAGVRKIAFVLEDLEGANIHANPTNERDIEKLEDSLFTKSLTYRTHMKAKELVT